MAAGCGAVQPDPALVASLPVHQHARVEPKGVPHIHHREVAEGLLNPPDGAPGDPRGPGRGVGGGGAGVSGGGGEGVGGGGGGGR